MSQQADDTGDRKPRVSKGSTDVQGPAFGKAVDLFDLGNIASEVTPRHPRDGSTVRQRSCEVAQVRQTRQSNPGETALGTQLRSRKCSV